MKIIKVFNSENCNVGKIGGFYGRKSDDAFFVHPDFAYLEDVLPFKFVQTTDSALFAYDSTFQSLYVSLFDAQLSLLPAGSMKIELGPSDLELLGELSTLAILNGVQKRYVDCLLDSLTIPTLSQAYFVKSNRTSGKNTTAVEPVTTRYELVVKMLSTVEWNFQYKHDPCTSIFLIPWLEICDMFEFRIFVYRRRIISICAQKWFKVFDYPEELETVLSNALDRFQTAFVDTFTHDNYSADIYLDGDEVRLIEVNPWGNSGPGLFSYGELVEVGTDVVWKQLNFPVVDT
jgi:hypothetical protein